MAKIDRLYIRVDAELKEKIRIAASNKNRTMSNFIENILKENFEKKEDR